VKKVFLFSIVLFLGAASIAKAIDIEEVVKSLKGDGLIGEIHGANSVNGYYVFTVRGAHFFDFEHFSLIGSNSQNETVLQSLQRHDLVKLKGVITDIRRPQKHILATSIEIVRKTDIELPDRRQQVVVPRDLMGLKEFVGKVHATANQGRVLVLEYGDAVIPVPVEERHLGFTRSLNRGDKVKVRYQLRSHPGRPQHIVLDSTSENPIEVVGAIGPDHGTEMTIEGALVLFPKSPQVLFDVYAIQTQIGDGVVRDYTLINFEKPELFKEIREKCELAWKSAPQVSVENARNKLINPKISAKVTGVINYVDPNQANPQVIIEDANQLSFTVEP